MGESTADDDGAIAFINSTAGGDDILTGGQNDHHLRRFVLLFIHRLFLLYLVRLL